MRSAHTLKCPCPKQEGRVFKNEFQIELERSPQERNYNYAESECIRNGNLSVSGREPQAGVCSNKVNIASRKVIHNLAECTEAKRRKCSGV